MFSTLRKLFCFHKKPRTPLGFCDGPSGERWKFFWCGSTSSEDRSCQPYDPENTFHEAVCMGKLKEALHLLANKNFKINYKDTGKRTALHFACFYGHLHLVYFLLFNGSEINTLDEKKCTPLMKAVQSREVQIVSVLLDQGADLNIKDRKGDSAIHQAVYSDSLDILSKLHDFGGDIEEKTKDGCTALLLALRERKLLIAEYLITHGANIHARDKLQRTALMYAVKWDSKNLVDLLLKKGVEHSATDRFGWSALMYAIVGKRRVKRTIVNHVNSLLSRTQSTFPGHQTEDIFSSGQNFKSESPISVGIEDKANCEAQQDIPENTLERGADDLPTASTEHENIEAQEEELELETIPDLKVENEDTSDTNEGYQNMDSSRKAAHSSTIGNDAEVNELNQVWAIKCPHPKLRDNSHPICKPKSELQQSQAGWAIKCPHPESIQLRDYSPPICKPESEPQQHHADKDVSEELKEEMPGAKPQEEKTFDKIEENQDISVSDPYGLQEASTEAPLSSNMDNDKEKNVISHLETESDNEVQRHTSEEEKGHHSSRKNKRTFNDHIRDFFCPCFMKNHSSSTCQKK